MIKKIIAFVLCLALLLPIVVSCNDDDVKMISFSHTYTIDALKDLDGQKVGIIGYMAKSSPPTGKYMYLMNMPYQDCPFCLPNSSQLSNTLAVYAKEGDKFDFVDRAIMVTGTLEIADIVDDFGYSYNYRIIDAEYRILDESELSGNLLKWQQLVRKCK